MAIDSKKFLDQLGVGTLWKKFIDYINLIVDAVDEVKVDKVEGKGLSTNDYTDAEKEKLAGLNGDTYATKEELNDHVSTAANTYATKTEAEGYANAKDAAITKAQSDATVAIADAAAAMKEAQSKTTMVEVEGKNYATKTEVENVLGKSTDTTENKTVYGAFAAAAAAQADINAFMLAADSGDAALDTLKEIQDFLESDSGTVQNLIKKVDNNTTKITNIVDGNLIVAHSSLADTATNAGNAENAINANKLNNVEASLYALKTDFANASVEKANIASGLDDTGLAQIQNVKVNNSYNADTASNALNLGGIEASKYALIANTATAAQGATADSALQSVSVGTGLKVSTKANNNQTIEFDDSVIFIFNCGSASTVI